MKKLRYREVILRWQSHDLDLDPLAPEYTLSHLIILFNTLYFFPRICFPSPKFCFPPHQHRFRAPRSRWDSTSSERPQTPTLAEAPGQHLQHPKFYIHISWLVISFLISWHILFISEPSKQLAQRSAFVGAQKLGYNGMLQCLRKLAVKSTHIWWYVLTCKICISWPSYPTSRNLP